MSQGYGEWTRAQVGVRAGRGGSIRSGLCLAQPSGVQMHACMTLTFGSEKRRGDNLTVIAATPSLIPVSIGP